MDKKILIVEDDPFIAAHLAILVEDELGCVALCAPTLEKAWKFVESGIDFALLDVEVGDGNTFSLATFMAQKGIPAIFVSGSDPNKVPSEIADTPFFSKPMRETKILEAARKYL